MVHCGIQGEDRKKWPLMKMGFLSNNISETIDNVETDLFQHILV